jgi:glycerol dehydrogenase
VSQPGDSAVRVFAGPQRYLQGPGALDQLASVLSGFGDVPLVIADPFVMDLLGPRIESHLVAAGLRPVFRRLNGEITRPAVDELVSSCAGTEPGVVVGVGGGKSIDAAKAVSVVLGLPVVTVPSVASNDSPTSAAVAMYDEQHVMVAVDRMTRSPAAVVVDTELVAKAPAHLLRAGIGDAISKKFEAEACLAGTGVTPWGTRPLLTGTAIADAAYRTIRRHGVGALKACERDEVTEDLEAVVEAVVLMSGLGFENGGLSLAHSLTRGLVLARGARAASHGDQIAWATPVQLVADGRSDADVVDLMGFLRELGLPTALADLGMTEPGSAEIAELARLTMTAPHLRNLAVRPDADSIAAAIEHTEHLASLVRVAQAT